MPRKSYREYQADIYPDTPGPVAAMGPLDWLQGGQMAPARISLNPANRQAAGGSHSPKFSTNQSNGTASKMAATESTNNELVVQINTTENVETSTNTSQAR